MSNFICLSPDIHHNIVVISGQETFKLSNDTPSSLCEELWDESASTIVLQSVSKIDKGGATKHRKDSNRSKMPKDIGACLPR
jgi:hypothetical protein